MLPNRRWITISEAAELLGIRPKSAYSMVARGVLPAAKVGRLVRIDLRALEADLEHQVVGRKKAAS